MERFPTKRVSSSPEETEAIGRDLGLALKPGAVVALTGGLGAGKTCLARGIAAALGIDENITSPTYTIVNEYPAGKRGIPLYHIDAYRLNGDEDFENTGAGECIGADGVAIVEWCDRIPRSIPPDAVTVTIEITGAHSRNIFVSPEGAR